MIEDRPKLTKTVTAILLAFTGLMSSGQELIPITADSQTFTAYFEEYGGKEWILIGRGREGWDFDTDGDGAPGDVSQNLKSVAGFPPAHFSDAIVNDLLSQAGLDMSSVELRVMRASDTTGTNDYQELRWTNFTGFPNGDLDFTFDFDVSSRRADIQRINAPAGLSGASVGGPTNDDIRDHSTAGNDGDRMFTFAWGGHGNQRGFSYGNSVGGINGNDPNTFLWENGTENHALPYTEVYMEYPIPLGDFEWTTISTSAVTTTSAQANATVDSNLDELVICWDVADGGINNTSDWTNVTSLGAQTAGAVSGAMSGLAADSSYVWRFFGRSGASSGWSSLTTFSTALSAAQAPTFTAATPDEDTIKLTWTDNANSETAHNVYRATAAGGPYNLLANLPANSTTHWDGGLGPGITYYYRLEAVNTDNGSTTDPVNAQTNATSIGADAITGGPLGLPGPTAGTTNPATGVSWAFGDLYQLAFVTSTETNVAGDQGIAHWNAHVNTVASGSTMPGVPQTTWWVLASTVDVDARDNAVVSVPVFLMDGSTPVADDLADMWDGSLTNDIVLDESGTSYSGETEAWTGSNSNGTGVNNRQIGNTLQTSVRTGHFPPGGGNWMANRDRAQTDTKRFLALSQPLELVDGSPDTTAPTPNPMTFSEGPAAASDTTISMTATQAYDVRTPPVQYFFENTDTAANSGWQSSPTWVDTVLEDSVNTYRVKARDGAGNETAFSATVQATPLLYGPSDIIAPTGTNPSTGNPWQPGDTYHLVFISSSESDTSSDGDITTWNNHVNTIADGSSITGVADATWFAMLSTPAVNARDNAVVSSPVYQMDGLTRAADNFADMWDGSLDNDIILDESGQHYSLSGSETEVWTGSSNNGNAVNNRQVGNTLQTNVRTAHFPAGGGNWFSNRDRAQTDTKRFYALSQELTILGGAVVDTDPPAPDPMTFFSAPAAASDTTITMTATAATDALSPPVEYFFENTTTAQNSGWQASTTWVNTVAANSLNTYRVKARDSAPTPNETAFSATAQSTTLLFGPGGIVAPTGPNPSTGNPWQVGDTYHLVFISSQETTTSSDGDITAFVNTVADGSTITGVSDASWFAMASTPAVDARDHAVVSSPVYLTDGLTKVADDFAGMWSGDKNIILDESGAHYSLSSGETEVWTGSASNGTKVNNREVGNPLQTSVRTGHFPAGSGNWFTNRDRAETDTKRFYGLSQELTILDGTEVDTTAPTPDPMTFANPPAGASTTTIEMTATVASDALSPPVEYYFENTTAVTNSGWQLSPSWTDTVAERAVNDYRVKARDASGNETAFSATFSSAPLMFGPNNIPAPTGMHPTAGRAWQFGDTYHLVFLTSTSTAIDNDQEIAFWNNYVNTVADTSTVNGVPEVDWKAMGSTIAVDARDNANITAPVYMLSASAPSTILVANDAADMWDGSIGAAIRYDEDGSYVSGGANRAWTGSLADGTKDVNEELNAAGSNSIRALWSNTNAGWFRNGAAAQTTSFRFYSISEELQISNPVPGATVIRIR